MSINSKDETKALLDELSYLPLEIMQAAAYVNFNEQTIEDYPSLLVSQRGKAMRLSSEESEDDLQQHSAQNRVATTFLISSEKISRDNPLATDYLHFMTCVVWKNIPLYLYQQPQIWKIIKRR